MKKIFSKPMILFYCMALVSAVLYTNMESNNFYLSDSDQYLKPGDLEIVSLSRYDAQGNWTSDTIEASIKPGEAKARERVANYNRIARNLQNGAFGSGPGYTYMATFLYQYANLFSAKIKAKHCGDLDRHLELITGDYLFFFQENGNSRGKIKQEYCMNSGELALISTF